MTSQPGLQTIAILILSNISRSKGNQTTKFGQLIEYNMRNIFVEKSCTKYDGEAIPKPFSKKTGHFFLPYIELFYRTKRSLQLVFLHSVHNF